MGHYTTYTPRIKGRNFCPNPVAKYGIPAYADSTVNFSVEGTVAHDEWWNEQIDYCLNGYMTGGIKIPGRYYYYLNFCWISTLKRGNHFPDYVDIDHEFFELIEEAKADYKGIICIKKRRVGLSEKFAKAIAGYGLRFYPEQYSAGIVSGLKEYSEELFSKFKEGNSNCPPEFRLHKLLDNTIEYKVGWQEKTLSGFVDRGSMNSVVCKTMFTNPNVMKGNKFDDVAFEESGENQVLIAGFNATSKCFAVGSKMVGTPFVYGTGGNIKSASKGFAEMWHDPDTYNLLKIPIYGDRLMVSCFVGSTNHLGKVEDNCPNIFNQYPDLEYEQMLGMEDTIEAKKIIIEEKARLKKGKDKKIYWNYVQEHCLNDRDAFLKFSGNEFNPDLLATRLDELLSSPRKYLRYLLDYKLCENPDDPNYGLPEYPISIVPRLAPDHLDDDECILVYQLPRTDIKDLDVGGIDSYDLDQSMTSNSLGAMEVLRRANTVPGLAKRAPVCIIRQRPARKEIFYDNCLKVAFWYNLIGNVNLDIANTGIMEHFNKNGGKKFWCVRPRSFESPDSQQKHLYGTKLTGYSKPLMIGKMQTYVEDSVNEVVFPIWITEHQDYDMEQEDSDWDLADAHGLALMRDIDMKRPPLEPRVTEKDPFEIQAWKDGTRSEWYDKKVEYDGYSEEDKLLIKRMKLQGINSH